LEKQLGAFKEKLELFAKKHKNDISKNPLFRRQFQEMCAQVGVDPLACMSQLHEFGIRSAGMMMAVLLFDRSQQGVLGPDPRCR